MQLPFLKTITLSLVIAFFTSSVSSLKHHLVLKNDHRRYFSVSSFGYLRGGKLDVVVQNLTFRPDPIEDPKFNDPQYGFMLWRANRIVMDTHEDQPSCMLNDPGDYFTLEPWNFMTFKLDPRRRAISVQCAGTKPMPAIKPMPNSSQLNDITATHHNVDKRSAILLNASLTDNPAEGNEERYPSVPETRMQNIRIPVTNCPNVHDLPLIINKDDMGAVSYSFNFTMLVEDHDQEALYYLIFHNCQGRRLQSRRAAITPTSFDLNMLIFETNYPDNYLSAGHIPLPQMYLALSVIFLLMGCIWIKFLARYKDARLKIHFLMSVLVFTKSFSLLLHGINYHYIAIYGQPVNTWAYLYYATRSFKGALFFITLTLIGSGWSFIKHILSDRDKKVILIVLVLQVIAHTAEIVLDESTEGEASNEFLANVFTLVDLICCFGILYPITWSIRHLEEASRTDGKQRINLKKLELFKRFYIISTVYIYVTRIVTFVFLSMITYRYSYLAELVSEFSTLVYFVITGYYFQPAPTNQYCQLTNDPDGDEDVLFNMEDAHSDNAKGKTESRASHNDSVGDSKVTRRLIEDIV